MPTALERKIELIESSTDRLKRALKLPQGRERRDFLRREAWIHVKRSLGLLWLVVRGGR